jgi:hypothetical protein
MPSLQYALSEILGSNDGGYEDYCPLRCDTV